VQYEYWNDEKNQAAGKTLLRIILTELDFVVFIKSHIFFGHRANCEIAIQVEVRNAGLMRTVDI
jgi:hypothetical protein